MFSAISQSLKSVLRPACFPSLLKNFGLTHTAMTDILPTKYTLYVSGQDQPMPIQPNPLDKSCSVDIVKGTAPKVNDDNQGNVFNVEKYLDGLKTEKLGRMIIHAPICHSTHLLMMNSFPSLPLGSVITADTQTHGKGRGSNIWVGPKGQLAFSFKISLPNADYLVFLQYLVSLTLTQTIHKTIHPEKVFYSRFSSLSSVEATEDVRMKWPNDIYAKKQKIGGVICNSSYNMEKQNYEVMVGVGVNVHNTTPTTCLGELYPNVSFSREKLLSDFFNLCEPNLEVFGREGFDPFIDAYMAHWLHSDEQLTLQNDLTKVTVKGLSKNGYLLAADRAGQKYELHPDVNSLDLFSGLLKKKIL